MCQLPYDIKLCRWAIFALRPCFYYFCCTYPLWWGSLSDADIPSDSFAREASHCRKRRTTCKTLHRVRPSHICTHAAGTACAQIWAGDTWTPFFLIFVFDRYVGTWIACAETEPVEAWRHYSPRHLKSVAHRIFFSPKFHDSWSKGLRSSLSFTDCGLEMLGYLWIVIGNCAHVCRNQLLGRKLKVEGWGNERFKKKRKEIILHILLILHVRSKWRHWLMGYPEWEFGSTMKGAKSHNEDVALRAAEKEICKQHIKVHAWCKQQEVKEKQEPKKASKGNVHLWGTTTLIWGWESPLSEEMV